MADELTFAFDAGDDKGTYELIAPDTYELVADKAEIKTSTSGVEYISLQWTIRGDIPDGNANQKKFAGRKVFDSIFKARDGSYGFDAKNPRFRTLVGVLLSPSEKSKSFGSLDDILDFITGNYAQGVVAIYSKSKKAEVTLEEAPKYVDSRNEIRWYRRTKHGAKTLGGTAPTPVTPADVSDDDLPF